MIGMNTAIASKTGESAGVGFAIPINTIARVVPQLIRRGRVIRPEIGIARVYETDRGLLIATITPGGAAERAGWAPRRGQAARVLRVPNHRSRLRRPDCRRGRKADQDGR